MVMAATAARFRAHLTNTPREWWRVTLLLLAMVGAPGPLGVSLAFVQAGGRADTSSQRPASATLTHVADVHELSQSAAAHHLPVRLLGVVTAVSGWRNSFFMQDASGGISVDSDAQPTGAEAGDRVEVTGVSDPGKFAALVQVSKVRILGRGVLPPPPLLTYAVLSSGLQDSRWIAIQGVVRSARFKPLWAKPVLTLSVDIGGGSVTVLIRNDMGVDPSRLVDAVVRVHGVCTTSFNEKRQFTGMGMFVTSMKEVEVKIPAPGDPYSVAVTPIRNVLRFQPGVPQGHRVKVEGTVTFQNRGHALYLQKGAEGILLYTEQDTAAPVGARVEAVGFPDPGTYSPMLRNAEFRILDATLSSPIRPLDIHAVDFLQGQDSFAFVPYDARLVRLQGQVVEMIPGMQNDVWLLRDGNTHFNILLKHQAAVRPPLIENGSVLESTGVLAVQVDETRGPVGFRLLLRGPEDMVVLRQASWWTNEHTAEVLLVVLLVTASTVLWGILLRRRVRAQTQMLRESEERFRRLAQSDGLTGMASRSFLLERLDEAVEKAREKGSRVGVLMVDLDHFKEVNDTLGHHAGDELLRMVAARIRESVRKTDLVARMGGDEFVVLLPDLRDVAEAELIGAKVVANVLAPAEIGGRLMAISASVGVCVYPDGGANGNALLQNVDAAMYRAKEGGRNSFSVYGRGDLTPKPLATLR